MNYAMLAAVKAELSKHTMRELEEMAEKCKGFCTESEIIKLMGL